MNNRSTIAALGLGLSALALAGCETVGDASASAAASLGYSASLTGSAEVPGPGDPDGTGRAQVRVISATDNICYDIDVRNIGAANAAHIHRGAISVAGPPVVTLSAPANGGSEGCVDVSDQLLDEIDANPAGFYVNVHNAEYPAGAVRGQLRR